MSDISKLNIHQRMLKATDEIGKVVKGLTVEAGGGKGYKAVGESDIIGAVKPVEIMNGIYSYPVSRKIIESAIIEFGKYNTKHQFMRVETLYRFVNIDNPSEYLEQISFADGLDSGDKAPGKAMTYCDKYALMKAYKIETGDDLDEDGEVETKYVKKEEVNPSKITPTQLSEIKRMANETELSALLEAEKVKSLNEMTYARAEKRLTQLYARESAKNAK